MSLILCQGTKPTNLSIKTFGCCDDKFVHLGKYKITMNDFVAAAMYVLTNTDLEENDPRLEFVKAVQRLKPVKGFNRGSKRLTIPKGKKK